MYIFLIGRRQTPCMILDCLRENRDTRVQLCTKHNPCGDIQKLIN